jgi:hypothetical protein
VVVDGSIADSAVVGRLHWQQLRAVVVEIEMGPWSTRMTKNGNYQLSDLSE